MKKLLSIGLLACLGFNSMAKDYSEYNEYTQKFLKMYDIIYNPNNGYFSADGLPYHSIEKFMVEAPDYGHESTSEAVSYWIWIDALYGGLTKDWSKLNRSIDLMEKFTIPTKEMQPNVGNYKPSSPATYASEMPTARQYPVALEGSVPVGSDGISNDLTAAYGSQVYGMHWLFDLDNFYGFGNMGDGTSTCSYINNFQRGVQESVWEAIPHPSWEEQKWGKPGEGFLSLFTKDPNGYAKQWRYTNAPDADARVVQAMMLAVDMAKEQNQDPAEIFPMDKISKLGDFVRLSFSDKYFKKIGCQNKQASGNGYESVHYLVSWYYSWGGGIGAQASWSWRIGSSHAHFGYQNPVCAYAMSQVPEFAPKSENGLRDWNESLNRQVELYQWLQSAEGGIAGGATNSYNGDYSQYPSGMATFYGMAYQEHPVYHDPGSNQWFGMQAWSMQRMCELYYLSNDPRVKKVCDKWAKWAVSEVKFYNDGTFEIPATLEWSGQPETWDPQNPKENTGLHVKVKEHGTDLGISGCLAKALIYYAAANKKYDKDSDFGAQKTAKEILDRMYKNFYEGDNGKGFSTEETRGDFKRFFTTDSLYVPNGWTGTMPNGDEIKPGVSFIDIRSNYKKLPGWAEFEADIKDDGEATMRYHRFWAQVDIMLAFGEYGRFFGESAADETVAVVDVRMKPETVKIETGEKFILEAIVDPIMADNKSVTWTSSNPAIVTVKDGVITGVSIGNAKVTVKTVDGNYTADCAVQVVGNGSITRYTLNARASMGGSVTLNPAPTNGGYAKGTFVTATAHAEEGYIFDGWSGASEAEGATTTVKVDGNTTLTANFKRGTVACSSPQVKELPFDFEGSGTYCFEINVPIDHVNSYNLNSLKINGVDLTNKWTNAIPAAVGGKYYVEYNGKSGGHLDIQSKEDIVGIPTGIEDAFVSTETVQISVYPNPFNDNVNVDLTNIDEVEKVELLDQSGRVLKAVSCSALTEKIELGSELSTGLYFVKITTATREYVAKILKQ